MLKNLFRFHSHLIMLVLVWILMVLSLTTDWRYVFAALLLVAAWLLGLTRAPARLCLEGREVVLRHDLGWVVDRAPLEGVSQVIFYLRPIPPGSMRMDVRNGRLHIDTSRVHRVGIAEFTEHIKAFGLEVDSSRIRKGAFVKKGPMKIKFRFPGSR